MVFDWGFRCFNDIEGNITNKFIYAFFFLDGKHREPQSINAKLFLPIIPIGIVAYALTLLWDNLCQNSCMQIAFAKLLAFWLLFSRRKSVFVCSRSLYHMISERKGVSFAVYMLYWNEIFKMFIPRNGNRLVSIQLSEYVAHVNLLRY